MGAEENQRFKERAWRFEERVTDGARTRDNRSHNPVLYQLSYGHQERGANMIGVPPEIKADFHAA
jgi:hypothetical protein